MIAIRKAVESDVHAIYALRKSAIIEKCSDFYTAEQLDLWTHGGISTALIKDIVDTFYVSEINGKVVGSGKLNTQNGMIDAIFVDPAYFGKGAAKSMLSFLETLAAENALTSLQLESTLNAAPFYRSCGFVGDIVATYRTPRGVCLDCIPMKKVIA